MHVRYMGLAPGRPDHSRRGFRKPISRCREGPVEVAPVALKLLALPPPAGAVPSEHAAGPGRARHSQSVRCFRARQRGRCSGKPEGLRGDRLRDGSLPGRVRRRTVCRLRALRAVPAGPATRAAARRSGLAAAGVPPLPGGQSRNAACAARTIDAACEPRNRLSRADAAAARDPAGYGGRPRYDRRPEQAGTPGSSRRTACAAAAHAAEAAGPMLRPVRPRAYTPHHLRCADGPTPARPDAGSRPNSRIGDAGGLRRPDACHGCGVEDWADPDQRMHYILHLFRAYHATPALYGEPFSPAETEAIRSGRLPDGEL